MDLRVAASVMTMPSFGRTISWELIFYPSSPIPDWEEVLLHLKHNPPPSMPASSAARALMVASFWVPLLKRLGLSAEFISVWIVWYQFNICSWEHLVDLIKWHIQTGLVPFPAKVE